MFEDVQHCAPLSLQLSIFSGDLLLFITEPCPGDGLALEWSPASEQEAVQGRDVSADGAGSAPPDAGKREASVRSAQPQRRPCAVQREGELRTAANRNEL